MKRKFYVCLFPLIALILELFPNGVVMRFANPEGEPWVKTVSFFDPLPYGYGNFGPFLSALITAALVILSVFYAVKGGRKLKKVLLILSLAAAVFAILPITFGVSYVTAIMVLVFASHIAQIILLIKNK